MKRIKVHFIDFYMMKRISVISVFFVFLFSTTLPLVADDVGPVGMAISDLYPFFYVFLNHSYYINISLDPFDVFPNLRQNAWVLFDTSEGLIIYKNDTSEFINITTTKTRINSLSKDSELIFYEDPDENNAGYIYRINQAASNKIFEEDDLQKDDERINLKNAFWSENGTKLYVNFERMINTWDDPEIDPEEWVRYPSFVRIYEFDISGNLLTEYTEKRISRGNEFVYIPSPDGKKGCIAQRYSPLQIENHAIGETYSISEKPLFYPRWSPNSEYLVYKPWSNVPMNLIITNTTGEYYELDIGQIYNGEYLSTTYDWSFDGIYIAFLLDSIDHELVKYGESYTDIAIYSINTQQIIQITNTTDIQENLPVWIDNDHILYTTLSGGYYIIEVNK